MSANIDELQLRRFTREGIDWFREFLMMASQQTNTAPPKPAQLADPKLTDPLDSTKVRRRRFSSRREAAECLHPAVSKLSGIDPYRDTGLWAWLSAVYLDTVAPLKIDGTRKIQGHERHILEGDRAFRSYRHLLAMPVNLWTTVRDTEHQGRLLLHGPVDYPGDIVGNIAGRANWMQNPSLLNALDQLYWDAEQGTPKSVARAKENTPGALRRLHSIIDQLEMTYDLFSMGADEIIELLPAEFSELAAVKGRQEKYHRAL